MINAGDTAWVLVSTAFVLLMTPGLAFFYGGMVRKKNILSVLMQCYIIICALSIQWVLFGYSLSFAPGGIFWGGLKWFGLNGVGMEPYANYAPTIPHQAFMIFQGMFAVITPALIIGAFAERMKFSAFLVFSLLWATFVYDPLIHWVWGDGGWLKQLGVLDFAGGIVVHTSAGIAALVAAIIIGKRKNLDTNTPTPHNLPFVVLGTGLLWFGWFGFNAGSALAANGLAVNAFVATNTAAASAGLIWALLEWIRNGKPTVFGVITGSVAGLATVTPASGFINASSALVIGVLASILCYIGVAVIKPKYGYDDSLDVFGVHGLGGILGTLAVGLFASKAINAAGNNGLFYGNPKQLVIQLVGVLVAGVYVFIVTFIIYKFVDIFFRMRVSEKEELMGLDLTQHRERAYTVLE
ncbi:MAG: ammonium transporter [Candidatus Omnitrophota bacterium]